MPPTLTRGTDMTPDVKPDMNDPDVQDAVFTRIITSLEAWAAAGYPETGP